jgi:methyltransferase family protein
VVARAARSGPRVVWHIARSHEAAARFGGQTDLVFVDGDHTPAGVRLDWDSWHGLVAPGGRVVFHDARLGQPGGDGWPGPTELVDGLFRGPAALVGWEIAGEADRTVAVRRH